MIIIDRHSETATLAINARHQEIITFTCVQTNVTTTMEVTDSALECMRCGLYDILTAPLQCGQYTYEIGGEKGIARVIDSGSTDKTYEHSTDNTVYNG